MITTAPQQKHFSLGDPRLKSLLLSWPGVRAAFPNTTDYELRSWIGGEEFPWCFNLGLGEREFIGVLASSVAAQQSRLGGASVPASRITNWDDAVKAALPSGPAFLKTKLERAWNISADQMDLLLPQIGCIAKKYQSTETRTVARASAEQFLNRRAMR